MVNERKMSAPGYARLNEWGDIFLLNKNNEGNGTNERSFWVEQTLGRKERNGQQRNTRDGLVPNSWSFLEAFGDWDWDRTSNKEGGSTMLYSFPFQIGRAHV